jgi:carboxylesterase type B
MNNNVSSARGAPVVRIQTGLLRGIGGEVRAFKGIPYAAPPIGPLRWRPPQPAPSWRGVRDATSFGDICPQEGVYVSDAMSEDCLTLNVWTPTGADRLSVMIWLHGGGWIRGASSNPRADGTVLARRGVVVVSINFRLGIFGFLAHPALSAESPEGVSSNYALRDQIAALEWVRDNIAEFGGDPGNVTVFGQSSGAQAICDLMMAPRARGLFARAIMQSAPVMRPSHLQMTLAQAEQDGRRYGDDLDALRAASPAALMAMIPFLDFETRANIANAFYPVCDGVILPVDEKTAFAGGEVARVPVIIGNNSDEGPHYGGNAPVRTLDGYRRYLHARFGVQAAEAERLYPAHDDASASYAQGVIIADTTISWGVRELARAMANVAPTYRYLYTHKRGGVPPNHADEIPILFGNPVDSRGGRSVPFTDEDVNVSGLMQEAWVNFAQTGNPNVQSIRWPRFDLQNQCHLEIDRRLAIGSGWRDTHIDFIACTLRR